jgi:hypothetical protein
MGVILTAAAFQAEGSISHARNLAASEEAPNCRSSPSELLYDPSMAEC